MYMYIYIDVLGLVGYLHINVHWTSKMIGSMPFRYLFYFPNQQSSLYICCNDQVRLDPSHHMTIKISLTAYPSTLSQWEAQNTFPAMEYFKLFLLIWFRWLWNSRTLNNPCITLTSTVDTCHRSAAFYTVYRICQYSIPCIVYANTPLLFLPLGHHNTRRHWSERLACAVTELSVHY